MSLSVAPENPKPYLLAESNSLAAVIDELEQNIEKSIRQLQALRAVNDAVVEKIERLGGNEQLEVDLEDTATA